MHNTEAAPGVETKTRVFISYSRKDMTFADRIEAALKARGFEVLIDRAEIYAFEDWWKRIEALIGTADTVVFVLSPDAVKSDVAGKEVAYAASLNKRFAPIVCRRVEDGSVPEALRRLNFIFFDDPEGFEDGANKLAAALQTDIAWIRRHTEYGDIAHRWIAAGRPGGMLLRPPVLDQAEAWLTFRPGGAPAPTAEARAFIAASRKAEMAMRRRSRILNSALYAMLVGIILGLVGWINQDYLKAQWRWYAAVRPFMKAKISPYVLPAMAEKGLMAKGTFRECAAEQGKDYCPEMVVVPAGSFIMGSETNASEEPPHRVTFEKQFAASKYDVTFAEWDTCVAYGDCEPNISDSGFGHGDQPVINVNWDDAQHYVAWLSKMTGRPYRLLSEAEYEYAARAGSQTTYPWGNEIGTNHADCIGCGSKWDNKQPAPVGSFAANGFGLYDMVGNVFEWLQDCGHNTYDGAPTNGSPWITGGDCKSRVVRGGSWLGHTQGLRSANRLWWTTAVVVGGATDSRYYDLGFRVARTLDKR